MLILVLLLHRRLEVRSRTYSLAYGRVLSQALLRVARVGGIVVLARQDRGDGVRDEAQHEGRDYLVGCGLVS